MSRRERISRTHRKGARSIAGSGPGRAAVQAHTLIPHNLHKATRPERLRVGPAILSSRQLLWNWRWAFSPRDVLPLDFEDVKREENDLSDTSQAKAPEPGQPECTPSELDKGREGTHDPAVADIMALPFFSPKVLVKVDLKFLPRKSLKYGWPPNWRSNDVGSERPGPYSGPTGASRKAYLVDTPVKEVEDSLVSLREFESGIVKPGHTAGLRTEERAGSMLASRRMTGRRGGVARGGERTLVSCCVAETREEGEELLASLCVGVLAEDDLHQRFLSACKGG